jgi:sarcosine oxidase subunit beta
MMRESLDMIERFADLIGIPGYDIGLRQQGYLFLTADAGRARQAEHIVKRQRQYGLTGVELLDGAAIRRRFPWVSPAVLAGRFNQRDGWLAVHELLWGFIKGAQADVFVQTNVTAIEQDKRGVCAVITDRGRIVTRRAAAAAGPFAGKVAALAGVNLPLLNVRRQEVRLARHGLCPPDAPMVIDDDNRTYWRPDGPAALLGGGETDSTPGEPLDHVAADWDFPALVLDNAARLSPFWADVAADLKADEVFINAGQYSYVADRCPVIGPTPVSGLYLNAAYDGHGVMGAPAGSRLLVDLITGRVPPQDNPFALERLASGRHLDIEEAIL